MAARGDAAEFFRDLHAENEQLKRQLADWMNLSGKPHRPPKVPATYKWRSGGFRRILVIPDTQVHPGVPTQHLEWIGRYIADKRPEVIVHLGDHWDLPSLSSWDTVGKKAFEGRAYTADVEAGNEAMDLLTSQYRKKRDYTPDEHFLIGNHEQRIERFLDDQVMLRGIIGYENLNLHGWNVHGFLKVVELGGVLFSHYFHGANSPRPIGGTAHNLLARVGRSCVQGHRQGLDSAVKNLPDGTMRRSLIAGSCYLHSESYRRQSNGEWRGIVMLHEVRDGNWGQMEVSLDYLRRRYG